MIKLKPFAVWGLVKEVRVATQDELPLVVSGVLAEQLQKELARNGSPGAARVGGRLEDAAALVRIIAGAPTAEDETELRAANRAGVPVIAVQTGTGTFDVPYVLATDVVVCPPGSGFPVNEIVRVLAARLDDRGPNLAARLPVLRGPVCDELIDGFSWKNGLL